MKTTLIMDKTLYHAYFSKDQQRNGYSDKERLEICKTIQEEWGLLYPVDRVECY